MPDGVPLPGPDARREVRVLEDERATRSQQRREALQCQARSLEMAEEVEVDDEVEGANQRRGDAFRAVELQGQDILASRSKAAGSNVRALEDRGSQAELAEELDRVGAVTGDGEQAHTAAEDPLSDEIRDKPTGMGHHRRRREQRRPIGVVGSGGSCCQLAEPHERHTRVAAAALAGRIPDEREGAGGRLGAQVDDRDDARPAGPAPDRRRGFVAHVGGISGT